MNDYTLLAAHIGRPVRRVWGVLLVISLFAVAASVQGQEAATVVDGLDNGKMKEGVDYAFLVVAYDDAKDSLWIAAHDGVRHDPALEAVYSVPVKAIHQVKVVSNTEDRGCTVHLETKEKGFGWAKLADGWVSDGKFLASYDDMAGTGANEADFGFFDCGHARKLQAEIEKLRHQVKKE